MALLSIAEPGQSNAGQHQTKQFALGIDLGTTNSLVAIADQDGARTLPDQEGRHLLPSVVQYLSTGNVKVGPAAREALQTNPADTIASVKRLMGRGAADISHDLPYTLIQADNGGMPLIKTVAGNKSPVEVSAEILRVLAARGREAVGAEIEGAVITVPAYFDEAQRQATKDAATIAGLKVLRLLSEPTAAAVAYGLDQRLEGTVIVYDLGGGTFDVSLMQLQQGVFKVLATGGDTALGGDDIDRALAQWILDNSGFDGQPDASQLSTLLAVANQAKHALGESEQTAINFNGWQGMLTREQFNQCADPLIERTLKACRRVLRDARVDKSGVDEVIMVGGSTRSPRVQDKVSEFFGQKLLCDIDPDRVVALGAARQADVLAGNKYGDDMLLLDVIPLSLGIETMGGLMEKIIPRNTPIPVSRAQEFTTFKDGQSVMSLHVLQGERELVSDCRSLAQFDLGGIPPMVAGAAKVRVSFRVDADGLMEVEAEEVRSGVKSQIVVKPSFGLEGEDIERMIKDSFSHAESDKLVRSLQETRVEAARMIEALEVALAEDGKVLLSSEEFGELSKSLAELNAVLEDSDAETIDRLTHALNELSRDFAARRMDAGISSALTGHTLDEME